MLPLLYHTHHSLHPEDLPFWLELAAQSPGPILELGCGTGRVLVPLAQAGHTVYGLDNDFEALTWLRQNLPAGLPSAPYVFQADCAHFPLAQPCGLILMPCNTYSTLPDPLRQATLENARRGLLPDGLLAVSLPNPGLFKRLPAHSDAEVEEVFEHPVSGDPVQVSSAWQRTRQRFIVYWHYDLLLPDGQVQRYTMQAAHNLLSAQAYLDELRQAGFDSLTIYGDFDRSPFTPDAPDMIILAG